MSIGSDLARGHDAHIRLAVLRLLDGQPTYCLNDSVLHEAVNAIGLPCTRDQLRGHLAWLEEMGTVSNSQTGSGLIVSTLTERGSDVALGRSIIHGVQRPSPKSFSRAG